MATIPTLNTPTYTPNQKVDFGTLGDLANTYRASQAQQLDVKQKADTGDLVKRAWAVQMGLPDPGAAGAPNSGGWLSNLKSYIGMGGQAAPPPGPSPTMIPQANMVMPTMNPAIAQGQVPMPMPSPIRYG